jgi:hypothetical protein
MLLSVPIALLFSPLLGAMEVFVPVMMTGMVAGMVVAMAAAMRPLSAGQEAALGAVVGVGVLSLLGLANGRLHGKVDPWTA